MAISPENRRTFDQICQIGLRRQRIIDSVGTHFGKAHVQSLLSAKGLAPSLALPGQTLEEFLTEVAIEESIVSLAFRQQLLEAQTIQALLSETSVYQSHVEEQILFGAKIAGQEACRNRFPQIAAFGGTLSPQEAIAGIVELTFCGLPSERGYFLMLRPFGASTIHFLNKVHELPWKKSGVELSFMERVKESWVKGILDILCPPLQFTRSNSLSQMDHCVYHFHQNSVDAHP